MNEAASADPYLVAKKLMGVNLYTIRVVGDDRVILSIEKGKMVILVIDLGHRSKIYKRL